MIFCNTIPVPAPDAQPMHPGSFNPVWCVGFDAPVGLHFSQFPGSPIDVNALLIPPKQRNSIP
jgi:hypothetical protein